MARPSLELISALRVTVARLRGGEQYQWSHQGCCNCGHLAQTLTRCSQAEIHRMALEKAGDWGEKAIEYCATSKYPIDHIIGVMLEVGLTQDDIYNLERLGDKRIVDRLPLGERNLARNRREDVVRYMEAWIGLLEEELSLQPPDGEGSNVSLIPHAGKKGAGDRDGQTNRQTDSDTRAA